MDVHEKNIKIMFWNARSIVKKKEEFSKIIPDFDIAVCVESWLNDKIKSFNFPGFKTFRKDRSHGTGGGILLVIRNNIAYTEIDNLRCSETSVELAGIRITNFHPNINLIICYRPPDETFSQSSWDEIISVTNEMENTILLGDFNSHHTSWNCTTNDTNGDRLLESIHRSDLILHNTDTITHITAHNGKTSNIDLVFSTPDLADTLHVKAIDDTWGVRPFSYLY